MYRETKRHRANQRAAKERKRLDGPTPDYPVELPNLRMRITIEKFDFGYERQVMELHKTNRIDCYNAYANGELWKTKIGLSRVLSEIRKANPRVLSVNG